jgi:hypothetical protein
MCVHVSEKMGKNGFIAEDGHFRTVQTLCRNLSDSKHNISIPKLLDIVTSIPAQKCFARFRPNLLYRENAPIGVQCSVCGEQVVCTKFMVLHICKMRQKKKTSVKFSDKDVEAMKLADEWCKCMLCSLGCTGNVHNCGWGLWRTLLSDLSGLPQACVSNYNEASDTAAILESSIELRARCMGMVRVCFVVPPTARSCNDDQLAQEASRHSSPIAMSEVFVFPSSLMAASMGAHASVEAKTESNEMHRGLYLTTELDHSGSDITEASCQEFSKRLVTRKATKPLVTRHFIGVCTGRAVLQRGKRGIDGTYKEEYAMSLAAMHVQGQHDARSVRYFPNLVGSVLCLANQAHECCQNVACSVEQFPADSEQHAAEKQPSKRTTYDRQAKQNAYAACRLQSVQYNLPIMMFHARIATKSASRCPALGLCPGWLADDDGAFMKSRAGNEILYDYRATRNTEEDGMAGKMCVCSRCMHTCTISDELVAAGLVSREWTQQELVPLQK